MRPSEFVQADATQLPFADQSFDLVFGSPPYADARTYGIGAQRGCQAWIDWMLDVTAEAVRVSRGLVIWICAGVTRKHCYWPGPEGLLYEWWKRGGQCWRPAYWHRVGIPGSGGKQWLRADVEYALCFTSCRAAVPWADNTANGHPPKWAPGGEMAYRLTDGARINGRDQWGRKSSTGNRDASGQRKKRNGRRVTRGSKNGDTIQEQAYEPPVLANPGVLIRLSLTLAELTHILIRYEQSKHSQAGEVLRELRQADSTSRLREWFYGVCLQVRAAEVLQHSMRDTAVRQTRSEQDVPDLPQDDSETSKRTAEGIPAEEVLQSQVPRPSDGQAGGTKARRLAASRTEDSSAADGQSNVRELRQNEPLGGSSSGRGRNEQRADESPSLVSVVPSQDPQDDYMQRAQLYESAQSQGLLQQTLLQIQEVWLSSCEVLWSREADASPNLIRGIKVGGGLMGHKLSHVNEAPYPQRLAEWFIRSWCPPGGRVLDPFSGSGTTVAAALALGRQGVGCDLRLSQCQLGRRRCADVQTELLG